MAPTHADAYFELGNALFSAHDLPAAERAYHSALATQPARALCYLNLGNLYADQGRVGRANRSYRRVLALAPSGWDGCAAFETRSRAAGPPLGWPAGPGWPMAGRNH